MVILKNLPFRDKLNLAMMIEYDTKKVIQEHARLINDVYRIYEIGMNASYGILYFF